MDQDKTLLKELARMTTSIGSVYACGGSVATHWPSRHGASTASLLFQQPSPNRITVRWDSPLPFQSYSINKIEFPLATSAEAASSFHPSLNALVHDCQPATFGQSGKDIYDESYRRAGKLDESNFSTNFHPADYGITAALAQALLPAVANSKSELRGVHVESYKLNIYSGHDSGPAGHFKAHVDAPRSEMQFGSLVVCPPCKHSGGELIVKHGGTSLRFDWSRRSAEPVVQWAAFYSDVEHAVLDVTGGHRITLTYNLYATAGAGQLAGRQMAMVSVSARWCIVFAADTIHRRARRACHSTLSPKTC